MIKLISFNVSLAVLFESIVNILQVIILKGSVIRLTLEKGYELLIDAFFSVFSVDYHDFRRSFCSILIINNISNSIHRNQGEVFVNQAIFFWKCQFFIAESMWNYIFKVWYFLIKFINDLPRENSVNDDFIVFYEFLQLLDETHWPKFEKSNADLAVFCVA